MKLAIITPTCRTEPRFDRMAKTIAANAVGGFFDHVEWIVVDALLWGEDTAARRETLVSACRATGHRTDMLSINHVPPKPSPWRGPFRTTEEDLPDHNGARNTGLALATDADVIFFLDDCSLLTQSTFECLFEATKKNACLRVPWFSSRVDVPIPPDGRVALHETGGMSLVACSAMTIAGGCFGAPRQAFVDVDGFDEIYGGTRGKNDLDLAVRMERAGWKWLTTRRCASIQLNQTHSTDDVTKNRAALTGQGGMKPWNALMRDRKRILPVQPAEPEPAEFLAQGTPVTLVEALP